MGEGLYWSRDGRTAYAEPFDHLDPEDVDLSQWAYEDFVAGVRASPQRRVVVGRARMA